jgi:hypothetical protein
MIKKSAVLLITLFFIVMIPMHGYADAIVDIIPEKPKALDNIELTATIIDENIIAVYTTIQECNSNTGICYASKNYSMVEGVENQFTASITLEKSDADYLQYTIHVQTADGWQVYEKDTIVNYDTTSSNNGGSKNDNDTPGFEFLALAISIMFISLLLYRRKR